MKSAFAEARVPVDAPCFDLSPFPPQIDLCHYHCTGRLPNFPPAFSLRLPINLTPTIFVIIFSFSSGFPALYPNVFNCSQTLIASNTYNNKDSWSVIIRLLHGENPSPYNIFTFLRPLFPFSVLISIIHSNRSNPLSFCLSDFRVFIIRLERQNDWNPKGSLFSHFQVVFWFFFV